MGRMERLAPFVGISRKTGVSVTEARSLAPALEESMDKSFKPGFSAALNLYRSVGKVNAAVMHYFDFCLEEYIEYLQEHPHIAVFEDNVLKYEIYRQYVGDAQSFNVQLTRNAKSYSSSLDNMGAVVTVFEY